MKILYMTRKARWILIGLVLILGLIPQGAAHAATPIYVRPGGDDVACNGTADVDYSPGVAPNCAVQSIQQGIDLVDSGGTVHLSGGTWTAVDRALAIINKPLTLEGDSAATTILEGGTYGSSSDTTGLGISWPRAVVIQAHNVTIRNLRIQNYQGTQTTTGGYGIVARAEASWGVPTSTLDNISIENIRFEDSYYGFRGQNLVSPAVLNNTYVLSGGNPSYFVYVVSASDPVLQGNTSDQGSYWVTDATNALIGGPDPADGNIVTDALYNGIWLGQQFVSGTSSDGVIQNNTVDGAGEGGIVVWNWPGESASVQILDNTVSGAQGGLDFHGGISIRQGTFANLIIRGNTSSNNIGRPGLLINGSVLNGAQIYGNAFINNPQEGVSLVNVTRSGDIAIFSNRIMDNTGQGLRMTGGSTTILNAAGNWWGNHSSASVRVDANGGTLVDYSPWLDNSMDTDGTAPGFQGDFSDLRVDDLSLSYNGIENIPDGIDAVDPGGMVTVSDGTYTYGVVIDKPVNLFTFNAVLQPPSGSAISFRSIGSVSLDMVVIEGFTIQSGSYGIAVDGGQWAHIPEDLILSNLVILDCTLQNATNEGLFIGNGATLTSLDLSGVTLTGNGNGIGISGTDTSLSGASLNAINSSNNGHGLLITADASVDDVRLNNSDLTNNSDEGIMISAGAQVSGLSLDGVNLTGNNNGLALSGAGTQVDGLTVSACDISGNNDHGVFARSGASLSNLDVQDSVFDQNGFQGIYLNGANLTTGSIQGGSVSGNDWGILLRDAAVNGLAVSEVTFENNAQGSGFSMASGSADGLDITGCTFLNNAWEHLDLGVGWMGASTLADITIQGNNFLGGPWASVYIDATAAFGVDDISLAHNRFFGGAAGISNGAAVTIGAENNWWGCNAGPNQTGCDTTNGLVDADPWLVLNLSVVENPVAHFLFGTADVTADLYSNSDGVDTSGDGVIPHLLATTFSATSGMVVPSNTQMVDSLATALFYPENGVSADVCVGLDNETVCTSYLRFFKILPYVNKN